MNFTLLANTLLAQYSNWRRLGDGLHRSRGRMEFAEMMPYLVGFIVLGIGAAIAIVIYQRNNHTNPCNDPKKLFRELSKAHRLSLSNQWLLKKLAGAFGLAQPVEVFITPSLFEPSLLPEHLRAEEQQILALREHLFK